MECLTAGSTQQVRLAAIAAAELVNAARRVDESLLARIEWVAGGADFDVKIFTERGAGFKRIAAAAVNFEFGVVGMDFRLHEGFP